MVKTRKSRKTVKEKQKDLELTVASFSKTKKQKRDEELKSKATGVGLEISVDSSLKKSKTVFENTPLDDEVEPETVVQQEVPPKEEDDDDDDDAVEEVQGQAAREEIQEQMDAEEKFSVRSKKKRKQKERKPKEEEEEDNDNFDDDFFAQLESARAEEQKKVEGKKTKGKHTAFVFSQEDKDSDERPREVDQNIQVVVLHDSVQDSTANAITAVPTNALSHEALQYSRGQLVNGSDGVARGATGKKRKWQPDNTWKRSKKMNNMVRVHRRGGGRMAPANFAKN
jgi:hypothetical protein